MCIYVYIYVYINIYIYMYIYVYIYIYIYIHIYNETLSGYNILKPTDDMPTDACFWATTAQQCMPTVEKISESSCN